MSDNDSSLEKELRELQPLAPGLHVAEAIAWNLRKPVAQPTAARRDWWWSLWASWSLTSAAVVALVIAWWPAAGAARSESSPTAEVAPAGDAAERRIVPVSTSHVLADAQDEGVVVLEDGRAARRLRLLYVETLRLRDGDTHAEIAVRRPREEVCFVPVNLY